MLESRLATLLGSLRHTPWTPASLERLTCQMLCNQNVLVVQCHDGRDRSPLRSSQRQIDEVTSPRLSRDTLHCVVGSWTSHFISLKLERVDPG